MKDNLDWGRVGGVGGVFQEDDVNLSWIQEVDGRSELDSGS